MTEPVQDEALRIVSDQVPYVLKDPTPDAMVLQISAEDLSVEKFESILKGLRKVGYNAFTGGEESSLLYLIKKRDSVISAFDPRTLKIILAVASLVTTIYAGFAYESTNAGITSFFSTVAPVLLLFVAPILVIMGSRELGRSIALKHDNIEYSFPILVPDPIMFGVMGSIMGHKEPFVTRGCMLRSGLYPLIFGFVSSIAFFVAGILMGSPRVITNVNSPTTSLSLPLLLSAILSTIAPQQASINLLAYAGWVGIMVNSFNAFPLGYLDGGLVASSLLPSYSKYLSYGSLVIMAFISYFSPAWFILLIFALIIGLQGPRPLYGLKGMGKRSRAIVLASILLILAGIAPIPLHVVPPNFSMSVSQSSFVLINGSNENLTLQATIVNTGGSTIAPAFMISPQVRLSQSSKTTEILPGGSSTYTIEIETWDLYNLGFNNYSLISNSGTSELRQTISILNVNASGPVSFSGSYVAHKHARPNEQFNMTFSYSSKGEKNLSVYFIAPDNFTYSVGYHNLSFAFTGPNELFGKPFSQDPGVPVVLAMEGYSNVSEWDVVVMTSTYQAAVADIYLA